MSLSKLDHFFLLLLINSDSSTENFCPKYVTFTAHLKVLKTIKFKNTSGVEVTYNQAGALTRIAAFIIDFIVYYIGFILLLLLFSIFIGESLAKIILAIVFFFTPMLVEMLTNGQSAGKLALGISVVSNFGRQCTSVEYFTRHVIRLIEIGLSLGLLPIVLISFSKRGQSLGDLFAGTTVIVKKKNARFTLKEITDIDTSKTYQVTYPEVRRLHEKDVIVLKTLLSDHKNKSGDKSRKLIDRAANKVVELLQVEKGKMTNSEFLNKIITDYIIATR